MDNALNLLKKYETIGETFVKNPKSTPKSRPDFLKHLELSIILCTF